MIRPIGMQMTYRLVTGLLAISIAGIVTGVSPPWDTSNTAGAATPVLKLGTNLIVNPGAETVTLTPSGLVAGLPGWTINTGSNFTALSYDTKGGPTHLDPGPTDRGRYYFSGGAYDYGPFAEQTIDVSSLADQIDAGRLAVAMSGWLGGWQSQEDYAALIAEFQAADHTKLSEVQIGPVTAKDRNNVTGLQYRQGTFGVPAKTRLIRVILQMHKAEGNWCDGSADNLSLVLSRA